jgi:hypothetical protein
VDAESSPATDRTNGPLARRLDTHATPAKTNTQAPTLATLIADSTLGIAL